MPKNPAVFSLATIVVLAFATAAIAADPIIGTWKLNVAKSKFASEGPQTPKEGMETYRAVGGDQIELTYTRTMKDGTSFLIKGQWPGQGGAVKVLEGAPEGVSWVETLISWGDWYVTRMQNGKQVGMMHKTLSKDGKTMIQTSRFMDAQGKLVEEVYVLDRQ